MLGWTVCLYLMLSLLVAASSSHLMFNTTKESVVKRQATGPPTTACDGSSEGSSKFNPVTPDMIWICKSGEWIPYHIEPSLGKIKSLSADSCKHIREVLTTDCTNLPNSGVYWVQDMQVYCDMTTDGGGWTLVWQHSYMETSPLSTNMYYFSDYYKACATYASGWCNIPDKKRFNPTEQIIVAYHKGTIVWAYKGAFNYNIDHDWTGGVLVDHKKIVDKCTSSGSPNIQPAPSAHGGDRALLGIAFDKRSPQNYLLNCDTIVNSFNSPGDCRWYDCYLPTTGKQEKQQTVAIYVR